MYSVAILAVLAILLIPLYYHFTNRIPSRLHPDQAPKVEFGVVPVGDIGSERPRAHGIDIIFVHGLGSNPDTTWRARKTTDQSIQGKASTCWVSDFLPEDIPLALRRDIRIFFYNYDSYWHRDAVQTRLRHFGIGMLNHIRGRIRSTETERSRNLIFVGHSYGGLVIKQALVQASRDSSFSDISEHTESIFFLGTPHRGSSTSIGGTVSAILLAPRGSNRHLLSELSYDSTFLRDLHSDFVNNTDRRLRVVNFFEQRPTNHLKINGFTLWWGVVVPVQSATYDAHLVENFGLTVDHSGLNKFASKNENYKSILQNLLQIIKPITLQRQQHHFSVPLETVPTYVERGTLSLEIEKKLSIVHDNRSLPHALVIHGLGGSGKTQLATKYVENHKDTYGTILWIDAKDENSVRSSFYRGAAELQLSVDQAHTPSPAFSDDPAIQTVLKWLRGRDDPEEKWLVVIDNADDLKWGIKQAIPKGTRGSVIVTSQDSNARKLIDGCEEIRVDVMEKQEARDLLLRHLKSNPDSAAYPAIHETCDKITERLGYLALAVDLAGAYIGNSDNGELALEKYLVDYDNHQDDLLQDESFRGLSATDKTVWTVWDTTLERIRTAYPDLAPDLLLAFLAHFKGAVVEDEMFRLASFNVPAVNQELYEGKMEIPDWLMKCFQSSDQGWDSFFYRRSTDVLIRYNLIQRLRSEWPGVTMHNLVQWRATKYTLHQPWGSWYLIFSTAACRQLRYEDKPDFRRHLIPHIPAVSADALGHLGVDSKKSEVVWSTISAIWYDEGRWKEAEELLVQVMETMKRVLGQEHPDTLTSMANLAYTYVSVNRMKDAINLMNMVVELRSIKLGPNHPHTLKALETLNAWTFESNSDDGQK